jgi:hypothetical protein
LVIFGKFFYPNFLNSNQVSNYQNLNINLFHSVLYLTDLNNFENPFSRTVSDVH